MKRARESAESGVDNNPAELGLLLEEAIRCLDSTDFPGANAALKKVLAGAASHGSSAAPGVRQPGTGSERCCAPSAGP